MAKLNELDCPRSVPWAFIEAHHKGCLDNHDQTPEELARRGGLAPAEIVAIIKGTANWTARKACWMMTPEQETTRLKELLAEWNATRKTAR